MKKVFFSLLAVALSTALFAQKTVKDVAKFSTEVIDLGKIKVGNPQPAKFIVTNISGEPLIIETATPTCGCTISDYTKSPIEPGKTGYISATYNAASVGHFDKTLTVKFAGVNEPMQIKITGDVVGAEENATPSAPVNNAANDVATPVTLSATPVKTTPVKTTKTKTPAKSKTTKSKTTVAKVQPKP